MSRVWAFTATLVRSEVEAFYSGLFGKARDGPSSCVNNSDQINGSYWQARNSAANCLRRLKYALQQAGIKVAIGGMDFSFNEDAKGKYKSFWSQHYYIITYALDLNKLKKALKKYFWDTEAVPRPVKISPFENKPRRRSYPLKTIFKRRIGYKAIRTDKSGRKRKCRNTRRDRLRSKERFELFIYLNKIGLASRVIFVGATPISDASGVSVARRRSRNQNKQPRIAEQTWR
jgi:hypothetical protein